MSGSGPDAKEEKVLITDWTKDKAFPDDHVYDHPDANLLPLIYALKKAHEDLNIQLKTRALIFAEADVAKVAIGLLESNNEDTEKHCFQYVLETNDNPNKENKNYLLTILKHCADKMNFDSFLYRLWAFIHYSSIHFNVAETTVSAICFTDLNIIFGLKVGEEIVIGTLPDINAFAVKEIRKMCYSVFNGPLSEKEAADKAMRYIVEYDQKPTINPLDIRDILMLLAIHPDEDGYCMKAMTSLFNTMVTKEKAFSSIMRFLYKNGVFTYPNQRLDEKDYLRFIFFESELDRLLLFQLLHHNIKNTRDSTFMKKATEYKMDAEMYSIMENRNEIKELGEYKGLKQAETARNNLKEFEKQPIKEEVFAAIDFTIPVFEIGLIYDVYSNLVRRPNPDRWSVPTYIEGWILGLCYDEIKCMAKKTDNPKRAFKYSPLFYRTFIEGTYHKKGFITKDQEQLLVIMDSKFNSWNKDPVKTQETVVSWVKHFMDPKKFPEPDKKDIIESLYEQLTRNTWGFEDDIKIDLNQLILLRQNFGVEEFKKLTGSGIDTWSGDIDYMHPQLCPVRPIEFPSEVSVNHLLVRRLNGNVNNIVYRIYEMRIKLFDTKLSSTSLQQDLFRFCYTMNSYQVDTNDEVKLRCSFIFLIREINKAMSTKICNYFLFYLKNEMLNVAAKDRMDTVRFLEKIIKDDPKNLSFGSCKVRLREFMFNILALRKNEYYENFFESLNHSLPSAGKDDYNIKDNTLNNLIPREFKQPVNLLMFPVEYGNFIYFNRLNPADEKSYAPNLLMRNRYAYMVMCRMYCIKRRQILDNKYKKINIMKGESTIKNRMNSYYSRETLVLNSMMTGADQLDLRHAPWQQRNKIAVAKWREFESSVVKKESSLDDIINKDLSYAQMFHILNYLFYFYPEKILGEMMINKLYTLNFSPTATTDIQNNDSILLSSCRPFWIFNDLKNIDLDTVIICEDAADTLFSKQKDKQAFVRDPVLDMEEKEFDALLSEFVAFEQEIKTNNPNPRVPILPPIQPEEENPNSYLKFQTPEYSKELKLSLGNRSISLIDLDFLPTLKQIFVNRSRNNVEQLVIIVLQDEKHAMTKAISDKFDREPFECLNRHCPNADKRQQVDYIDEQTVFLITGNKSNDAIEPYINTQYQTVEIFVSYFPSFDLKKFITFLIHTNNDTRKKDMNINVRLCNMDEKGVTNSSNTELLNKLIDVALENKPNLRNPMVLDQLKTDEKKEERKHSLSSSSSLSDSDEEGKGEEKKKPDLSLLYTSGYDSDEEKEVKMPNPKGS